MRKSPENKNYVTQENSKSKRSPKINKALTSSEMIIPSTSDNAKTEEDLYIEGLLARGEVYNPEKDTKWPNGATHILVTNEDGKQKPVRRRFTSF